MRYTNKIRKSIAFYNKMRIKHRDRLKKVTDAAKKVKAQIKKMDNIDELDQLSVEDLTEVFGQAMADLIIISYDAGNKNSRKRKKEKAKNLITLAAFRKDPSQIFNSDEIDPDKLWEIDWSIEDKEALEAFRNEAFEVAGILSEEMLEVVKEEAAKALRDGSTFDEWRKAVKLKGFEAGNPYHLRTNFNTAINNSYLAANWNQAQKDVDVFPFLKYVAVMDDKVRDEHAALHGYIYHAGDPFWDENYPPNGWNCRCDVEQLMRSEAKDDPMFGKEAPSVEIDENFQKNSGRDNTIWGDWLEDNR